MDEHAIHPTLTLDEAHIVLMNTRTSNPSGVLTKLDFQLRLDNLQRHTTDSCLLHSIQTLQEKIRHLSPAEFNQLYQDSIRNRILQSDNYPLPSIPTDCARPGRTPVPTMHTL